MKNGFFWKTTENMRKRRDIKLAATEGRKNYLVSQPSYHATKFSLENLLAIEIKKRLSILELSKILMYDFWYDYVKPKNGEKS